MDGHVKQEARSHLGVVRNVNPGEQSEGTRKAHRLCFLLYQVTSALCSFTS